MATTTHEDYIVLLEELTASLNNPDFRAVRRVLKHLDLWRVCPTCREEAVTDDCSDTEKSFEDAYAADLRRRYPRASFVGGVKLKDASILRDISLYLEGKHLFQRRREADREGAWLFRVMWNDDGGKKEDC